MVLSDLPSRGSMVKKCMQSLPQVFGKLTLFSSPILLTAPALSPVEAKNPDHFKGPAWLGILYVFSRPHVLKAAEKLLFYSAAVVFATRYDCPGTALLALMIFLRIIGSSS